MFTLFKATIHDYDINALDNAKIGPFIGYIYYLSYLIINLILIVNLIVAKLAYGYKFYQKNREVLRLLATLEVREVT